MLQRNLSLINFWAANGVLAQIVLFGLFCCLRDLPICDGGRCLSAPTTLDRGSFPPLLKGSVCFQERTKCIEVNSIQSIVFVTMMVVSTRFRETQRLTHQTSQRSEEQPPSNRKKPRAGKGSGYNYQAASEGIELVHGSTTSSIDH